MEVNTEKYQTHLCACMICDVKDKTKCILSVCCPLYLIHNHAKAVEKATKNKSYYEFFALSCIGLNFFNTNNIREHYKI